MHGCLQVMDLGRRPSIQPHLCAAVRPHTPHVRGVIQVPKNQSSSPLAAAQQQRYSAPWDLHTQQKKDIAVFLSRPAHTTICWHPLCWSSQQRRHPVTPCHTCMLEDPPTHNHRSGAFCFTAAAVHTQQHTKATHLLSYSTQHNTLSPLGKQQGSTQPHETHEGTHASHCCSASKGTLGTAATQRSNTYKA